MMESISLGPIPEEDLKYRTLQRRRTKTVLGKFAIFQVGKQY
jgi:hypothetical protein